MNEWILMAHVFFGVACMLAAAWLFVDVLNVNAASIARIRVISWLAAAFMWVAFVIKPKLLVRAANFRPKRIEAIILGATGRSRIIWSWRPRSISSSCSSLLATYLPIVASDNLSRE